MCTGLAETLLTVALPLWAVAAGPSLEALRSRTAEEPENGRAWVNLGRAELRAGNPEAAEAACRKATALAPDAWRAELCVGEALLALQRWDEAERTLRSAAAQADGDPRPLLALGHGALKRKDYEAAAVILRSASGSCDAGPSERAEDGSGSSTAPLMSVCVETYTKLGFALKRLDDLPEAEKALRRAVALDPKNYHAQLNLGTVLREGRELEGARAAYEAAARAGPDRPEAWFNLGNLDRVEGDWTAAAVHHVRAFECRLDRPDLGLQALGSAVTAQDGEAARRVLRALETLKLTPDQQTSMERLRRRLPQVDETPSKPASPAGR